MNSSPFLALDDVIFYALQRLGYRKQQSDIQEKGKTMKMAFDLGLDAAKALQKRAISARTATILAGLVTAAAGTAYTINKAKNWASGTRGLMRQREQESGFTGEDSVWSGPSSATQSGPITKPPVTKPPTL